jgi:hypothetical protein
MICLSHVKTPRPIVRRAALFLVARHAPRPVLFQWKNTGMQFLLYTALGGALGFLYAVVSGYQHAMGGMPLLSLPALVAGMITLTISVGVEVPACW